MKKFFLIFLSWVISIIIAIVYFHENPEKINKIKKYFKEDKNVVLGHQTGDMLRSPGNSFIIEFSKEISFSEKTAFVVHDENYLRFDPNTLKIYFQNGFLYQNSELKKISLPSAFTTTKNGGIKSIFTYKDYDFALISSLKNKCFYASIVSLKNEKELFKTQCLPNDKIDFNGLGSSHIHLNDKIFLSIGAPEQASHQIRSLAQNKNSMFGKIVEINKKDLNKNN